MVAKKPKPRTTERAQAKPKPKTPTKRVTPRRAAKSASTTRPPAKRAAAKKAPAKKTPAKTATTKKAAPKKRPAKKTPVKRPKAGTLERVVFDELYALELHDTALGKSAIFLAKAAEDSGSASAVAAALREMRMQISAAEVRGNPVPKSLRGNEQPAETDGDGVVPESRLERMRREREEQRRDSNG